MSKDFYYTDLQSICSLITDGKHGDCKNQRNSGYYFLSAKDIIDGKLSYENARQITKEDFQETHQRTQLEPFDILITNSGTIGRMAIATDHDFTYRTTFQKSVALLKPIKEKIFPPYLYYYLNSRKIDLVNTASGTTQQNLLLKDLRSFQVKIPIRMDTQRCTAEILSAFDEKIELNRKTNQTLGEMAQAIFKGWFIDFNYPGATGEMVESPLGPIPKDWRVVPLDQMATFLNGLALQKYPPVPDETPIPVIKIKELRNGVTESSDLASRAIPEQYIVENGDLLFSWSGSLDVMFWAGGDGALNQHLFKVTSDEYPLWFVFLWIKHHLPNFRGIAADKATTMGHIKRIDLTEALCLIPDDLVTAENTFDPLFKLHHQNELENETLRNVRDNLLPKLMNGEIEV